MNEQQLYELIGRKQATIEAQDAAYTHLLNVLAAVQVGAIDPSRLQVDLDKRLWKVAPPAATPVEESAE